MQIRVKAFPPMPTRPCAFCLSLQDGSVFADFDVDENGRVFLVRISFDGHGCCHTADSTGSMNARDSRTLLEMINSEAVEGEECDRILRAYFRRNKHVIWKDALNEHLLL